MNIFEFNHIDPSINQEKLSEIKALYKYYHEQFWCFKKTYKVFKKINLATNISSACLIGAGVLAGGITANPIVLGTITTSGLMLKVYSEIKDFKKKIEMSKFAFTTYQKVLVDLRSNLRGNEFDYTSYIKELRLLDEIIIDTCPIIADKIIKMYGKKFTSD